METHHKKKSLSFDEPHATTVASSSRVREPTMIDEPGEVRLTNLNHAEHCSLECQGNECS